MEKEKTNKMPETLKRAVSTLMKPYGIDFLELLKNKMVATKKYLSIKDAERYSSESRWTLWRAIKAGELIAAKLSKSKSGKVLIKKEDLDHYIESHIIKHSTQ